MKYYVVTTTDDDGWQATHTTIAVKKSLTEALQVMHNEENKFKARHDWDNEKQNFEVKKNKNYWWYSYEGDWWFKISLEEIEEV